jgi:prolyl oligopeptidase
MHPLVFALVLGGLAGAASAQTVPYPLTPVKPVSEQLHGTTVVDNYRWMEDMKSTEFQTWLKTQARYANGVLAQLPGRAALRARLGELQDAGETTAAYTPTAGGAIFYLKREQGQNQYRLWLRAGLDGADRQLLDPESLPGQSGRHAIDWFSASADARYLAVGLSQGGSEDSVLRVLDVGSGELLGEAIAQTGLNQDGVAWLPDGSGFFYNRHPADERYNKSAVYLHKLGQTSDQPVFGWGVDKKRRFEVPDLPFVHLQRGSAWMLAEVLHGDAAERSYWVAPLSSLKGAATPWRRLIAPKDKVTKAVLAGDKVYAISQRQASRRELLSLDLKARKSSFATVLPAGELVLQQALVGDDAVYVKALDGGVSRLLRVPRDGGATSPVALPFDGTVREMAALPGGELLLRMDGWTQPAQALVMNPAKPEQPARVSSLQRQPKLDTSGLQAERVMVRSHDGVMVPLSIVSAKGSPRDGRRPTILSGYGAYGIVMEPRFSASRMAWIERGGVSAVCHVRGGGELGEDWHRGGYILTKQNTVADFIACAEWLQSRGYASPATLAGSGGSAGGITIGGAITQRPELFAAAQSAVGVSDMLRMELTPNGAPNVAEFGTVTKPDHFKAMYAISPYHRVQDGRSYPAVIVTTGANDPRVDAWMPAKLAARLQAATPGSYKTRPVILRVDFDGGHGMGSGVRQMLDETADVWSFFLWQMGDAAFQPPR